MINLHYLNRNQLERLKAEQAKTIEDYRISSTYSSNPTSCINNLKRMQNRLNEIDSALSKFS
jgi:hypothetical protein